MSEIEERLNAEAAFCNIKMEHASKVDIAKASMIEYDAASLKGQGTIYYVCGCCGKMVLKGMSAEQSDALASVLFACTPCNVLMRIPARTIASCTAQTKQNSEELDNRSNKRSRR